MTLLFKHFFLLLYLCDVKGARGISPIQQSHCSDYEDLSPSHLIFRLFVFIRKSEIKGKGG